MIHLGTAIPGGAILPAPYGRRGLPPAELAALPGYGDAARNKEQARWPLEPIVAGKPATAADRGGAG